MKSSSGQYFIALDHVRAVAALMVFTWHFTHTKVGAPVPFEYAPSFFPFSVFDEGHTGVALFMSLSGYLFAKLLDGKKINYLSFLYNRFLRLVPLLTVVIIAVGIRHYVQGGRISVYAINTIKGIVYPTLPNGGWSITAEFHFYLVLPFLLWLSWKSKYALMGIIAAMVLLRCVLYTVLGEIHTLAYWTIVGRLDQFVLGIIAYRFHMHFTRRHLSMFFFAVFFFCFYWWFDRQGGFFNYPSYPSPRAVWIIMPTIEGAFYGTMIAWYDTSFSHSRNRISRFVATIGTYSYSIYLLHFFFVFTMSSVIHHHVIDLSCFPVTLIFALICFIAMVPFGYLSYRFVELPFLRLRTRYIDNGT